MKRSVGLSAFILVLLAIAGWSGEAPVAGAGDPAAEIRSVLDKALEAFNKKDVAENMAFMHPGSPGYKVTLAKTKEMLEKYDVTAEVVEYHFVGVTGDYALIRIKQRNVFKQGPSKGTDVELVHALKRHEGKWKFWSLMQLDMKVR
jgi:hypothetical protein